MYIDLSEWDPYHPLLAISMPRYTQEAWTDTKLLFFCSSKVSLGRPSLIRSVDLRSAMKMTSSCTKIRDLRSSKLHTLIVLPSESSRIGNHPVTFLAPSTHCAINPVTSWAPNMKGVLNHSLSLQICPSVQWSPSHCRSGFLIWSISNLSKCDNL